LEILGQEQPWLEVTDDVAKVCLFIDALEVVKRVATKADAPAIQRILENPTPLMKSRPAIVAQLCLVLAQLDPERSTEVILAEFRRNPKQALLAVQLVRTTGLKHWDAIAPVIQEYPVRRDLLVPLGELRSNQAAKILGELLAKENLTPKLNGFGGGGNDELIARELFDDYEAVGLVGLLYSSAGAARSF